MSIKPHFGNVASLVVVALAVLFFRKQVLGLANKVPFIGGPTGLLKIQPTELV